MMTRTRSALLAVAATAGLATPLFAVGPASADSIRQTDPADASGSLNDIRDVRLDYANQKVKVKVKVADLRRRSEAGPAGMTIHFDTNRGKAGPEYSLGTGLQDGTDYALVRSKGWSASGSSLVSCNQYGLRLDYARDWVVFWAKPACLGNPKALRVSVFMRDDYDGSHPIRDWAPAFHKWSKPVTRG